MNFNKLTKTLLVVFSLFFLSYTNASPISKGGKGKKHHAHIEKAIAVIQPTQGNTAKGRVVFTKKGDAIEVDIELSGLTPGDHGFHVHQFGDISAPNGTATGGHFNPTHHEHGAPNASMRHVGDLGNIVADKDGNVKKVFTDKTIRLNGPNSIIGRGVIIHAKKDDLVSQPTGAAGPRVGQGVIGIAKSE